MASICSTCKYNSGCIDDLVKVFRIDDLCGFPSNAIFCKARKYERQTSNFIITLPKEKCDYWEVCNNGYNRQTT